MNKLTNEMVNAVRILSIDQVQAANSGHPGAPMGAAPMTTELWANHMVFNPNNPDFLRRDRFVLSAGHASAMLYSLLHLFGYDLSLEELKKFRQYGSKTPGHPEYKHTPGVECTTGPLGAGFAMAVGMAMSERHLASVFNKDDATLIDNYTYVYAGDGCMMESINTEAASIAGTMGLGKLIVFYDSNNITIEGNTDLAFTEDVSKRYDAYDWQVLKVEDGNDTNAIGKAIEEAKKETSKPTLIIIKTFIGFGCEERQNTAKAHGEPLGADNVKKVRQFFKWSSQEPFIIPQNIYDDYKKIADEKIQKCDELQKEIDDYFKKYPEMKTLYDKYFGDNNSDYVEEFEKLYATKPEKAMATRATSGDILQKVKDFVPNLIGGSADLAPSNKSVMEGESYFSKTTPNGRNIHYGVRELAMTGISNGIFCYGGLRAYLATFFVFSDYTKPMLRLSCLMKAPIICIFTHDSIGVGEDGATHQPIEQLTALRATPNINVFRPADYTETVAAWETAILSKTTPTLLVLTRQNLPQQKGSSIEALNGGYIISNSEKLVPDGIIIATGSEVELAIEAQKELKQEGIDVRIVSMPCTNIFDKQPNEYKEKILPKDVTKRLAVEAGATDGWWKYVGLNGDVIGIDEFGISAPAKEVFKHFGITTENVVNRFKNLK